MTDGEATVHLGVVVYVWGALHQDRLLVECLSPVAAELRRQGLARRFWFDRNDARGPHLFTVLTLPHQAAPEIADRLTALLGSHLAAHPSAAVLLPGQLAHRHEETREKRQCEADGWPGIAANNSFEIFEHPPHGYPFFLSERHTGEEEVWARLAELALWAIRRLAARPGVPAMETARRWIASVHRELLLAGAPAADYWLHHATSLLPNLFAGLGAQEMAAALAELAAQVGSAHPALSQAWQEGATADPAWLGLPGVIRLILGGGLASPWPLLREVNHTVLKQLGVPTALHLPMVLYAWRQSMQEREV